MALPSFSRRRTLWLGCGWGLLGASWLSGCTTPPSVPVAQQPQPTPPVDTQRPRPSAARHAREYRADAARHLYERNRERIFSGRLPPLLYAVGVVRVHLGANGDLLEIDWMRKPSHAPEVVTEIERTLREAAPYPAAQHLGALIYTDTWLWHKSGRFQLDTLTEGQT